MARVSKPCAAPRDAPLSDRPPSVPPSSLVMPATLGHAHLSAALSGSPAQAAQPGTSGYVASMPTRGSQEAKERRARMRERQKQQERALDAFDKATLRLEREEQRRVDTIKKLEEQVATAKADQLLA